MRREEERLKANQAEVDGLLSSIALAPTDDLKRLTYGKIEALTHEIQAIENAIQEIKARLTDNVVNLEGAFQLFKSFDRAFDKMPAHIQRDLIRDAVKRVTITGPSTATVDYYVSPQEEALFLRGSPIDFSEDKIKKHTQGRVCLFCLEWWSKSDNVRTLYFLLISLTFHPNPTPLNRHF